MTHTFLRVVFIVAAALIMSLHPTPASAAERPNVVLVITDDQGPGDLSCMGNPVVQTPNLDAFYGESIRLTNFHVSPTCAPTRSSLLSGHYAGYAGVWHTIGGRSLIREREWLLPQALTEAGYATGMFGKWHLGDSYPYRPHDRGFDTAIYHGAGGIGQMPDAWGNDYFDDLYHVNGELKRFEGYCTDVWFGEGIKYIQEHVKQSPNQPFFCYIALNAPHGPFNVPPKYKKKYEGKVDENQARFYGMIENVDENFGDLTQALDALNIADDTIVIFMTDNGSSMSMTGKGGFPKSGFNAGLRGHKGTHYDGGHRVPFFVRWTNGKLIDVGDINTLTHGIDVMPTLLDLCNVDVPESYGFHGKSLRPLLTNANPDWPARTLITESQRVPTPIKWRKSCVMTDRWRLLDGQTLYDINADRAQRNDIADQHPDVVQELRAAYEAWWPMVYSDAELPAPLPIGDPRSPGPLHLFSHDWRYSPEQGRVPWNQAMIREGLMHTGFWIVDVRTPGRYAVELRRWPKESGIAITGKPDPTNDVEWDKKGVQPGRENAYTGGRAIDIQSAVVAVGPRSATVEVKPDDQVVTVELDLPAGLTEFHANFITQDGERVGAYYATVRTIK